MKRALMLSACALVIAGAAPKVMGSVIPSFSNQKWEVNLDGFGTIVGVDTDGSAGPDAFLLRSLTKVTSLFKSQGVVSSPPSEFTIGLDGLPGTVADQGFPPVVGTMLTGLQVIAIDEFSAGSYTRQTSLAGIISALSSPAQKDIIYFGAQTGLSPTALFFQDSDVTNVELQPGGAFNTAGDVYDSPATTQNFGTGFSNLLFSALFQEMGGVDADSTGRSAPAGTYLTQVLSAGDVRPFAMLDVIPGSGPEAGLILADGMTFARDLDTNADNVINGTDGGASKSFVGDIAISLASKVPGTGGLPAGFSSLSDPAEFVTTPEPVSIVVWAGLISVGALLRRSRG